MGQILQSRRQIWTPSLPLRPSRFMVEKLNLVDFQRWTADSEKSGQYVSCVPEMAVRCWPWPQSSQCLTRAQRMVLSRWLWASYSCEQGALVSPWLLTRVLVLTTWVSPQGPHSMATNFPQSRKSEERAIRNHSAFYDSVSEVAIISALFFPLGVTKSKPQWEAGEITPCLARRTVTEFVAVSANHHTSLQHGPVIQTEWQSLQLVLC